MPFLPKSTTLDINAKRLYSLPEYVVYTGGSIQCPKCQNQLVFDDFCVTDRGYQSIHTCSVCASSFAHIPVQEFRLFEVIPQ